MHTTDSLSSANLLLNGDSLSIPLPFDDSNGPSPGRYTPTPQLPPLTGKMSPTPPMSPSGFSLGLGDGLMEMAELPHDMIASPVPVPKTPTSLSYLPGEHSPDWAGMLAKLKDSPSPSPSPSYLPRPKRQMVTTPLARRCISAPGDGAVGKGAIVGGWQPRPPPPPPPDPPRHGAQVTHRGA